MNLVYRIVRRLFRDDDVAFSRNRNFDAYEDPKVKRALRIYRHLQSVERELLQAEDSGVALECLQQQEGDEERIMLQLRWQGQGGGQRTSYLTPTEWMLLLENERVSDILRRLVAQASQEVREMIPAEIL